MDESNTSSASMRVSTIKVHNFRLLRDVTINLDAGATLLVGKNNSGKTTLAEVFTRFLQSKDLHFTLADFSAECYPQFLEAWEAYTASDEEKARQLLPEISLTVEISYSKELPEYGPLAAAIVDLDPECTTAVLRFNYSLSGGSLSKLFGDVTNYQAKGEKPELESLLDTIKDQIGKSYARSIFAIDPADETNTRQLEIKDARNILTVHFLKAQRGLDDEKERPKDLIGRLLQNLFDTANHATDNSDLKNIAEELTAAVSDIEKDLGSKVNNMVEGLLPALKDFGYPGLNDPGLKAETRLDVERVLGNHTSIRYKGVAGVTLPESYSGLGSRNLILILLTLLSYYREYAKRESLPGLHLIFIEEPEAHLHPQMQEVFISQIKLLSENFPPLNENGQKWMPQFVVSTHSSHIVNRASFSTIRYFRVEKVQDGEFGHQTKVLNLAQAEGIDEKFLHQYLTLTRADLFFADKAILVEGISERLIVPAYIKKTNHKLSNQYITLMEVGGAYAYIFFPLLKFLNIPALIITDIDAVGAHEDQDKKQNVATTVHKGKTTSNATIKNWFPVESRQQPTKLLEAAETGEIIRDNLYLAFQVPEEGQQACGRTFEDAFLLANPSVEALELTGDFNQYERRARDAASKFKKSDFALRFAICETNWELPRYIRNGLDWLADYPTKVAHEIVNETADENEEVSR